MKSILNLIHRLNKIHIYLQIVDTQKFEKGRAEGEAMARELLAKLQG